MQILCANRLAAERKIQMDWEVPGLSHKLPFSHDVLEGKSFVLTGAEVRIRIQLQLLTTFSKSGGHLRVLEDFRTHVGFSTDNAASTSDFNWSRKHISVSSWSIF